MVTITFDTQLVTKSDAIKLENAIRTEVNRLERELLVIKWVVGLVLGGILARVLKVFFPG